MRHAKPAPYKAMTLADLSAALCAPADEATRQRLLQEFLEEYRWGPAACRAELIAVRPCPTGDPRYDAYLGALDEHLAYHECLPMPSWAEEPDRFLDMWWFPVSLPSVRVDAIVHSPAAFRRRGIFIGQGALDRA